MRRVFVCISVVAIAVLAGCHAPSARHLDVRLRVLGTAQDGGIPHAGCSCEHCEGARRNPSRRRHVSSLALIVPRNDGSNGVHLVDATPDVREQLDMLRDVRDEPAGRVDRAPVDGVLLTHAHIGHYTGLMFFGFEAVHTSGVPVWCSPMMAEFLRTNGPWSQLVSIGNIAIREVKAGEAFEVEERVTVTPLLVPHRAEYTDTLGFIFDAGGDRVLFVPDTEPWRTWQTPLPEFIRAEGIEVAIVDATFYSADELPGRAVSSIGHPLVEDTMDLLEPLVREGRLRVILTHLNHSNPALEPAGPAAREVRRRGFEIAREGMEVRLSP